MKDICPSCRKVAHLKLCKVITDLPLTDDLGNSLTNHPTSYFCEDCIKKIKEEPILFSIEDCD